MTTPGSLSRSQMTYNQSRKFARGTYQSWLPLCSQGARENMQWYAVVTRVQLELLFDGDMLTLQRFQAVIPVASCSHDIGIVIVRA